jgi:fructokinase
MIKSNPLALCFGEMLWDSLPEGIFPGGAPLNVAYHLHHQGVVPRLTSAVGQDWLGDELLRRIKHWGLSTDGVARLPDAPTGTVVAAPGADGEVRYTIATDVAWDRITVDTEALQAAASASAIIFGSLAQRSEHNQAALARLLAAMPADARIVFDVNLRPPHDDLERVRALSRHATVLKLNASEAARLAGEAASAAGREEAHARRIAEETGCGVVCVTAGARGAGLLHSGNWLWQPARRVKVADTVGAGDAFLAALLAGLLAGRRPDIVLARACRLGEWVASQRGATPAGKPGRRPRAR